MRKDIEPVAVFIAVIGRPSLSVVWYRSVTMSFSVRVAGVAAAVQDTIAPSPVNAPPTSLDHWYVSCDTGVSASVTTAVTRTVSSNDANCAGSRGPTEPCTTIELIAGGVFVTGVGA